MPILENRKDILKLEHLVADIVARILRRYQTEVEGRSVFINDLATVSHHNLSALIVEFDAVKIKELEQVVSQGTVLEGVNATFVHLPLLKLSQEGQYHAEEQERADASREGVVQSALAQHHFADKHEILQLRVNFKSPHKLINVEKPAFFVETNIEINASLRLGKFDDRHSRVFEHFDVGEDVRIFLDCLTGLGQQSLLVVNFAHENHINVTIGKIQLGYEGAERNQRAVIDRSLNDLLDPIHGSNPEHVVFLFWSNILVEIDDFTVQSNVGIFDSLRALVKPW